MHAHITIDGQTIMNTNITRTPTAPTPAGLTELLQQAKHPGQPGLLALLPALLNGVNQDKNITAHLRNRYNGYDLTVNYEYYE